MVDFNNKKQAYLKYVTYLILAANSINNYVPDGELGEHIDAISEMEEIRTKLEAATNNEELEKIINE